MKRVTSNIKMIAQSIQRTAVLVMAGLVLGMVTTACTQMPTEKQSVSDMRPQISFQLERENLASAQVWVDGLSMGQAGSYVAGQASLRVMPGTHELKVVMGSQVILSERIYLADGVNKSFVLK